MASQETSNESISGNSGEPARKRFKKSNDEVVPDIDSAITSSENAYTNTANSEEYSELMTFPASVLEGKTSSPTSPGQTHESQSLENKDDSSKESQITNHELEGVEENGNKSSEGPTVLERENSKESEETEVEEPISEETEKPKPQESSDDIEVVQAKIVANKKKSIHRKDIRKIMSVDQLDEETVAAQREEAERLQRIMQKQQNLKQSQSTNSLLALSIEDVMKRMASNGVNLSLADLSADLDDIPFLPEIIEQKSDEPKDLKPESKHEIQVEHEVYTLSSDDEEPIQDKSKPEKCTNKPTKIDYDFCKSSGGVFYTRNSNNDNLIVLDDEEPSSSKDHKTEDSDDDDCRIISPPQSDDDDDEELEEKNENANMPDEFGRVLVNVGHPEDEPDIFLPDQIAQAMKPHQVGGVRFLYDNLVESLDRYEKSSGFGCILAHSMGLGKTIQAAAFCEVFLRCTSAKTILVIVPINTVQNWSYEFNHWLTTKINTTSTLGLSNGKRKVSAKEDILSGCDDFKVACKSPIEQEATSGGESTSSNDATKDNQKSLNLFVLNETYKTLAAREKIISEWGAAGGVLLIGYEMYRMLALKKLKKNTRKKLPTNHLNGNELTEEQDNLLTKIHTYLVKPGPDLVICDEGHRIKNSGASISQALKAIRTKRRVVLTGYPLQNNLMEYWCMVDFIRPNYLGSKSEFSNMFERPISNGQCADSTQQDKRLMQFRSHVLHDLLRGFVQRQSHLVLQRALPPKEEHVFLVKMSPIQFQLYKEYISYIQLQVDMGYSTPNPIKAFAVCSKLWNHPDVLFKVIKKKQSVLDDLELEDFVEVKKIRKPAKSSMFSSGYSQCSTSNNNMFDDRECFFTGQKPENVRKERQAQDTLLSLEWATSSFTDYTPGIIENGTKFELLFVVIEETLVVGDKLLIFSQSLLTLDLMESFFHKKYDWKKGQEYFRLDGSTHGLERERLINEFNGQSKAQIFLVSTKAGSLGVNLIGANRVVVFDASWNPCHDCQAVCRIYRYGQTKPCQIYRFVTDYTLEKQIYDRQIHKGGMSNRVIDEMNPDSLFNSRELLSTLFLEIKDLDRSQKSSSEFDASIYADSVIQALLTKSGNQISREPFEHESLLIDRKEKKLSASERRQAFRNYEMEKKAATNYGNGSGFGPGRPPNSSGGIIYPMLGKPFPGQSDWSDSSSIQSTSAAGYQNYSYGGGAERPVASVRPYQRDIYEPSSVSMMPDTKAPGSNLNWAEVIEGLRRRGVLTTQLIALKKHYILPNPSGRDTYLNPGDTLELIRARKCSYIRLSSGQFMAMRRGTRGFAFLDTIPFSKYLSSEELEIFLSSFLRQVSSASMLPRDAYYNFSSSSRSNGTTKYENGMHLPNKYNFSPPEPPVSFPLPPTLPYGAFSNHQNLQVSNPISNSGGDVTIWRNEHKPDGERSPRVQGDLIPDIELIKISNSSQSSRRNSDSYRDSNSIRTTRINLTEQVGTSSSNNFNLHKPSSSRVFPGTSRNLLGAASSNDLVQPRSQSDFLTWPDQNGFAPFQKSSQESQRRRDDAKLDSSGSAGSSRRHSELNNFTPSEMLASRLGLNGLTPSTSRFNLSLPRGSEDLFKQSGILNQEIMKNDAKKLQGYYEEIEGFPFSGYNNDNSSLSNTNQTLHQYYNQDPTTNNENNDNLTYSFSHKTRNIE